MERIININNFYYKCLDEIISGNSHVEAPAEDCCDFTCDLKEFYAEAERCGISYAILSASEIRYSCEHEPKMNLSLFDKYVAYTVIEAAKSIPKMRDAQKSIEQCQKKISQADAIFPSLSEKLRQLF